MTPAARRPRSWLRLLRLLPAAAFVIAMAPAGLLAAPSTAEHAADCKCGPKCRRGACCCGPKATSRATPRAVPAAEPDDAAAPDPDGPCLGVAPRDEAAAPVKIATVGAGEAALAALFARLAPPRPDRLPPPSSDRPATTAAPPLDRPPESDAPA